MMKRLLNLLPRRPEDREIITDLDFERFDLQNEIRILKEDIEDLKECLGQQQEEAYSNEVNKKLMRENERLQVDVCKWKEMHDHIRDDMHKLHSQLLEYATQNKGN